ncbi:hypothetical protein ACIQC9_07230 [Brevundimonas sp. NPDC092305]|uniref:hypothetical protein n=1 Tax=Brevundimonas sp. NPDC092305 TaxID=3363957 RepID=UPI0037FEA853
MKTKLTLLSILAGASLISACDDPRPDDRGDDVQVEAQSAEDAAVETAAPESAPSPIDTAPPADQGALPPDTKSSEESVQPESETLFY